MNESYMGWEEGPMTEQLFADLWDENGNLTQIARTQIVVDEFVWTLQGQDGLSDSAFYAMKKRLLETLVSEWSLPDEYEDFLSMLRLVIDV
jgi:hypothetical protein